MPRLLLILLLVIAAKVCCAQQKEEYKIHLNSIDRTLKNPDAYNFIRYTKKNLLLKPSDIQFISNRKLLPQLKHTVCDSFKTKIWDTLKTGESCVIEIEIKPFDSTEHQIVFDSINHYKIIDGEIGWFGFPDFEISAFSITLNDKKLQIPKSVYQLFFDLNVCEDYYFYRKVEAYTSIDGQFIYIYFYGGNAAGTFFSKLIFDKEKFVTYILADYYSLSIHASFSSRFIGF